jgi:hypothetical protein
MLKAKWIVNLLLEAPRDSRKNLNNLNCDSINAIAFL